MGQQPVGVRCEYMLRLEQWPYAHRCENAATVLVEVRGVDTRMCSKHAKAWYKQKAQEER